MITKQAKRITELEIQLAEHEARIDELESQYAINLPNNDKLERNLRGSKVKIKVSGQWRSAKGTEDYFKIRRANATALKQGLMPIEVLPTKQNLALE